MATPDIVFGRRHRRAREGNIETGGPRIAVLISTYDGEAFLPAQLDSLLAQSGVEVEVFARDDGSTDATLEVLARYAWRWPQLAAPLGGENLRAAMSFLALLGQAPDGFDAYAFCDQDDVWAPDKLARATRRLAEEAGDGPALYCSRVMLTDVALRPLGPSRAGGDARFEHLLFENMAIGNTVVLNPAARALVLSRMPDAGVAMHDWWCALVVSAFGRVLFDDRPGVLYRQHGANEIGMAAGRAKHLARLARRFLRAPGRFYPGRAQAIEFRRLFGEAMSAPRRELVEAFIDSRRTFFSRIAFASSARLNRTSPLEELALRILMVAGLY